MDALGKLVRNRRLELMLRIDDAAHACGVASSVLSRFENGGTIGSDRLLRILSGLGLTMFIFTREAGLLHQRTVSRSSFPASVPAADTEQTDDGLP